MSTIEMNAYEWINLFASMVGSGVLLQFVAIQGNRPYVESRQFYVNGLSILIGTIMFVMNQGIMHIAV